jgi:hypothetical protein
MQDHCCHRRERDREEGEKESTEKWGRKMMGLEFLFYFIWMM